MKKLSIVVPMYNEEEVIELFYKETKKVVDEVSKKYDYEMLFVNDGSKDSTLDKVKELRKKDKKIRYISFSRNFGKEAGIYAGLKNSKGDIVVLLDADLQHDPKYIIEMLKYIEEGFDTVTTIRNRKGESKVKSYFSESFYKIMKEAKDIELKQGSQDYRMMTRQVVDSILQIKEHNRFSKGIFSWVGFKTKYIEVENRTRAAGKSKWNFRSLVKYAIEGITSFTLKPLKISVVIGILISIVALFSAIAIIIQTLIQGKDVPGYASIITTILFMGGIQLISIGILSEYVGKIYLETKNRPDYLIKEKSKDED